MSRLSRRQLVLGAGSAALLAGCGRLPWQQEPKVYRVGWLDTDDTSPAWYEAFQEGMRERGYVEGQNLVIEIRRGPLEAEQIRARARDLVRLSPEVIVATTPPNATMALQTTNTIPIVFGTSADPVGQGLVASLARPGGNATGLSAMGAVLSGKRVELLAGIVPSLKRLALMYRPGSREALPRDETEAAARLLGIEPLLLEAPSGQDLEGLVERAVGQGAEALLALPGTLGYAAAIAQLGLRHGLPTMGVTGEFAVAGLLMSYGPNRGALLGRAAYYVDRILKGAKPADLPVEQPMTFEFVVNMKTARELGVTFPHEVALQITEVIE
jgi:putative ABC transport system substrate-binding protein